MAVKSFYLYLILCLIFGYISVAFGFFDVPFSLDNELAPADFFYSYPIVIGLASFFISGYFFPKQMVQKNISTSSVISVTEFRPSYPTIYKANLIALLLQTLLFMYFIGKVLINYETISNSEVIIFRVLVGKESFFLLALQGVIPLLSRGIWKPLFYLCAMTTALAFAWLDGSRSSLIPLGLLVIYGVTEKKYRISLFLVLFQIFLYFFLSESRSIDDKANIDLFFEAFFGSFLGMGDALLALVSYTFIYSMLHFIITFKNELGVFVASDLFYSVLPVPSALIPVEVDPSNWRVDKYRPMGALAELVRVSHIFLTFWFFFLGCVARNIDRIKTNMVKSLASAVFFIILLSMFQYHLRGVMWLVFFCILLVFLERKSKINEQEK